MNQMLRHIFVVSTVCAVAGCKLPVDSKSFDAGANVEGLQILNNPAGETVADLTWTCKGKGIRSKTGALAQFEYCEWESGAFNAQLHANSPVSGKNIATAVKQSTMTQCVFKSGLSLSRRYRMFRPSNTFDALTGSKMSGPFWTAPSPNSKNINQMGGLFGPCYDRKPPVNCAGAFKMKLCDPNRAADEAVCSELNKLAKKGCVVALNPSPPGADAPFNFELTFDPALQKHCRYENDPSQKNSLVADKTIVVCSAPVASFANCDAMAERITVHGKVVLKNWGEGQCK